MKALSVRQPWAAALADGQKKIEFRSRPINYRGKLLICASKSGEDFFIEPAFGEFKGKKVFLPKGVMMGVVEIIDCRPTTDEDLKEFGAPDSKDGWFSWILSDDFDTVIPKEIKGKVSLFNVDDDLIESIPTADNENEQLFWFNYDFPNKTVY